MPNLIQEADLNAFQSVVVPLFAWQAKGVHFPLNVVQTLPAHPTKHEKTCQLPPYQAKIFWVPLLLVPPCWRCVCVCVSGEGGGACHGLTLIIII